LKGSYYRFGLQRALLNSHQILAKTDRSLRQAHEWYALLLGAEKYLVAVLWPEYAVTHLSHPTHPDKDGRHLATHFCSIVLNIQIPFVRRHHLAHT
jgi:hypothetical protein